MVDRVQTTARRGLRFRSSPLDGETIDVFPAGTELEALATENWLRVRGPDGRIGFVSAEYVEPTRGDRQPEAAAAVGIVEFRHSQVSGSAPVRIDAAFSAAMSGVAETARECNLEIYVTSSLRRPGERVDNAIVPPARLSNHHIGHAIDFNLKDSESWYNSARLADYASLPAHVRQFLDRVREEHRLRWGGDFSTPDPVHIDDGLNRKEPERFAVLVKSLWGHRMV